MGRLALDGRRGSVRTRQAGRLAIGALLLRLLAASPPVLRGQQLARGSRRAAAGDADLSFAARPSHSDAVRVAAAWGGLPIRDRRVATGSPYGLIRDLL